VEFVQTIRDQMSETRLAVVKDTFQFLDKKKDGRLTLAFLDSNYRAHLHPRVRTRQKTA